MHENLDKEELLINLIEECAEVQQAATKIIRFGNHFGDLERELGDLECIVQMLCERKLMDINKVMSQVPHKRAKLKESSNISV